MERKFKSKLVAVKASEVRKQAIVHLKETIELNKFKQIEPVDYDAYIEGNLAQLRKDVCAKQMILLPSDDVYAAHASSAKSTEENLKLFALKSNELNLFALDCLNTYFNKPYEIKHKYNSYAGNFRQLPKKEQYDDLSVASNLPEILYEIDAESTLKQASKVNDPNMNLNEKSLLKNETLFERTGWLYYKQNDTSKNLKKRFFRLHLVEAASVKGLIIEPRYRLLNHEITSQNEEITSNSCPRKVYTLDCYKELAHLNNKTTPKFRIVFDYNIKELKKVVNNSKNSSQTCSFELNEISIETNKELKHLFVADCQKTFDDWFTSLEKIICLNQKNRLSSSEIDEKLVNSNNNSNKQTGANLVVLSCSTDTSSGSSMCTSSLSEPSSSIGSVEAHSSNQSSGRSSHFIDHDFKSMNNLAQHELIEKFDLDKYLNENDEDLLTNNTQNGDDDATHKNEQINLFELYSKHEKNESNLVNEETQLETVWPEQPMGRKLLLEFDHLKLNLCYPDTAIDLKSNNSSFRSHTTQHINPELFYLIFAIYDTKHNQKISENFYHIPNYDYFYNQVITSLMNENSSTNSTINLNSNRNSMCATKSKHSLFSLDGKQLFDENQHQFSSNASQNAYLAKLNFLNKIKKALFTIADVHDDIYLVVRIEKCLDGASLHQALQPYMLPVSETSRVKTAIKLNKKMQQLLRTKLASYRQPFAWAAKPIYKKVKQQGAQTYSYELDSESKFQIYEQDVLTLSDEHLFKYLSDLRTKEKYLHKLNEISGTLKLFMNDFPADLFADPSTYNINRTSLITSAYVLHSNIDYTNRNSNDFILRVDYFDLRLANNDTPTTTTTTTSSSNSSDLDSENLLRISRLIRTNISYRSFLYVYPKSLKFDQQKVFSKARNLLVRTELRESDSLDESFGLKCILNLNKNFLINNENNVYSSNHMTQITHHNKNPQFYDEIKILLPLNLNEKHHLFFKFYHVSCTNAKSISINSVTLKGDEYGTMDSGSVNSNNMSNFVGASKSIETLVGYAWLPIFKNGRLITGEKCLPLAHLITSDYLTADLSSEIKWIDGMKPLFRVSLVPLTTIHTTDPHVANFYNQAEKLEKLSTKLLPNENPTNNCNSISKNQIPTSVNKKRAPHLSSSSSSASSLSNHLNNNDSNSHFVLSTVSEINPVINSNKEIIHNSIKGLHATELYTIIKYIPSLLSRILKTLITNVNADVSIHSVRALLHIVWQATVIGKLDVLKSFVKYIFYIDYTPHFESNATLRLATVHNELISNLVVLMNQILPIQDLCQMDRLYKNCWFFLEITLKSLCMYHIQYNQYFKRDGLVTPLADSEFYNALKTLYELLTESIIKFGSTVSLATKDTEFINSYKSCNRSLAIFIKKSFSILNRKFLFQLINKYLDSFHVCDKSLIEIKFDFIRIICNHEHYIALSLPIKKLVSNINEFADMKYEFLLSDQFRKFHFLVGVLLSQLLLSLNESKEQRRSVIYILRNLVCKHSYDNRYNDDRNKQARIASLYLPLIDVLIENISRINLNVNQTPLATAASIKSSSNEEKRHSSIRLVNQNGTSSTTSLLNDNLSFEGSTKLNSNETSSVLGVIAGLNTANKLPNQIESLIVPISDSDSLSSADDTQFKKRSSSLITGSNNSDNLTLNNSNSVNISNMLVPSSHHTNSNSLEHGGVSNKSYCLIRKDKLDSSEVKELLICLVYVLRHISQDSLLGLLLNYEENEYVDFLTLLESCLKTFRYRGKSNILTLNEISKGKAMKALMRSPRNANTTNLDQLLERIGKQQQQQQLLSDQLDEFESKNQIEQSILYEANLCHQVSLIVLNILSLIQIHQKEKLSENHGDNAITRRLVEIYFFLLQSNQSELIKLKTFASIRLLINKIPSIFLDGKPNLCADLCLKLLKCFNSKFQSIRFESCVVIYLLMRKNYEHTKQKSINRVQSQTIISLSKLIGNMKISSSIEVLDCLNILNSLVACDKTYQNTRFALEVDDLTKRIRNIFMTTAQMKNYEDDAEMLIDSQYSLAKSYANCLELRRTWLDSMAAIHIREKNYAEAAYCYLHIAALVAENLKHQGMYTLGCSVFKKITPNIDLEEELNTNNETMNASEAYMMNDLNEVQCTQTQLLDYLCKSADMLKQAERYDSLPNIFKLAVAIYETNRDYEHLQQMHLNIQRAYSYMAQRDKDQRASEKPLGSYYRISFYGKMFNDENNKVYIYKEPGNTKLYEICDRLRKVYAERFGSLDLVEILRDSRKPSELKLDTSNKNYIQVTSVQPYFDANDLAERVNFFDRNNNLKKFFYEIPYQLKENELETTISDDSSQHSMAPAQHSELLRLCKRKIILETSHWFPYVKKRILVIYEKPIELNPLETAIDEIKQKIESFEAILRKKDLTLLELFLQGGIIPQVHKGPLAYAEAFLEPNELNRNYSKELKKEFKITFKRLIDSYQKGIDMYGQLANRQLINNNASNSSEENSNRLSLNVSNLINSTIIMTSMNNAQSQQQQSHTVTKYFEMYRLLQEKFNEVENSFRNLLLIDGDFDLYQQQLNTHSQTSRSQILTDINNTSILTSSHA